MRQTIKDIEVNVAYRCFLGLTLEDKVSHFTTYGKNYSRRFQEKGLIEHIFSHVLNQVMRAGLVDPTEIFVDGTHIKAAANNHKYTKQAVEQQVKFMSEQLALEIDRDRERTNSPLDCLSPQEKAWLRQRKSQRLTLKVAGSIVTRFVEPCQPELENGRARE